MDVNEIKTLVDKYFEGIATTAEERRLKDYFMGDAVDASLKGDREFFLAAVQASQFPETDAAEAQGREQRLSRQIDAWNRVEKSSSRATRRFDLRWMGGIAASILVILSLGVFLSERHDRQEMAVEDTYSDPRDAAAETQRALTKFSIALNKGLGKLEKKSDATSWRD